MPEELRAVVTSIRWQEVWRWLATWLAPRRSLLSSVEVYLIDEFLEFMREEALDDPAAIRAIDVIALTRLGRARRLIGELRDGAESVVAKHWDVVGRHNRDNGRFWRHFRPHGVTAEQWQLETRGGWFEWGLTSDRRLAIPRKELVFGAGYTYKGRRPPPGRDVVRWTTEREKDGFVLGVDEHWRLYRYRYLDAVLVHTELTEQARMIGEWVLESFAMLRENPLGPEIAETVEGMGGV